MNRIAFWGTLLSLLSAFIFGLAWMGWIKIPFVDTQTAEATAFWLSSVFAIAAFAYGLHEKGKSSTPRYLAPPPSSLLPGIIPRTDELRKLRRELLQAQRPMVICGVGGLGKTTFTQQFCQRYGGEFDHVVWLYAGAVFSNDPARETDNEGYFLRAFTENRALLTNLDIVFEDKEMPIERFQKVLTKLGNVQGRLLLVIDNAPEVAARYVDDLSHLHNARILLTSRDAIHNMEAFWLDTLSPNKAAQVFFNIYGQRTMDPALDELLQAYGFHTLTIELLAAYAREKKLNPSELQAELQHKSLLDLDSYDLSLPNAPKRQSLRERLLQTFLFELDEKEREIMRYMCILPTAGAPIEPELMSEEMLALLFGKTATKVELHNVLQGLTRLHWLVEENGDYRCHPVIAETAKAQIDPDALNCAVLIENVTNFLVPEEETNEPQIKRAPYGPLAEAVFKGVWKERGYFVEENDTVAGLAAWLGNLFGSMGEIFKSLDYIQKALTIREKVLPSEHPLLAFSYNNLAQTYGALGEHQKRLEYNQKALSIWEKVPPPEHHYLAGSYHNLAATYDDLGEYQKSLKYNQKALSIWEKVLPPEHPYLAKSYNNIAATYAALGSIKKSLKYNQKALSIRENVLAPEHPDLAGSYNNIAANYGALDEHQKRLEYNHKALSIWEKVLPPEHPDLATSYYNLAANYGALREHQKRLEYNQKALSIREKALPPEHLDLAASYNNLAATYKALGDLGQAVDFMRQAVTIFEKSLPSTHPHVAMAKKNLASLEEQMRG